MIKDNYLEKLERENKLLKAENMSLKDAGKQNEKLKPALLQALYQLRNMTFRYYEDTQPTISINTVYDMAEDKFARHLDTVFVEKFREDTRGLDGKQIKDRMKEAGCL